MGLLLTDAVSLLLGPVVKCWLVVLLFFLVCFSLTSVHLHSTSPIWKTPPAAQDLGACPARLWGAGRAAHPYVWPAPSGLN